mgnify:CR=1 FL=1
MCLSVTGSGLMDGNLSKYKLEIERGREATSVGIPKGGLRQTGDNLFCPYGSTLTRQIFALRALKTSLNLPIVSIPPCPFHFFEDFPRYYVQPQSVQASHYAFF